MNTDKFFLSLWGVGKRRALVPPASGYVDLALGFQCHEEVYVQTMVLQCSRVPTCSMSVVSNLQMVLNWVPLPLVLKVERFIEHSQGCIGLASSHTMHDAAVS
jgi:hypothetical protein